MASLQSRLSDLIAAIGADHKALDTSIELNRTQLTINSTASTAFALALTDAGDAVETTAATAVTITVPLNATIAFPVGTVVEVTQCGAGQVTFAPEGAVNIRSRDTVLKIAGQWGVAYLRKRATDEWVLTGDLVA